MPSLWEIIVEKQTDIEKIIQAVRLKTKFRSPHAQSIFTLTVSRQIKDSFKKVCFATSFLRF